MSGSNFTHAVSTVQCSIEVYPYEGGMYHIDPGQIVACTVSKNMGRGGGFSVTLAPGGPGGPNSQVQWSEIITPMSFILIGMQRGTHASIVMAGIVDPINDSEVWSSANPPRVTRGFNFSGSDFSYFFTVFNWFAMTALGLADGQAFGTALGITPIGVPHVISQGQFGGYSSNSNNPVAIGKFWYEKIMTGKGTGILGQSYVPYKNNSRVIFQDAMAAVWENYKGVYVPFYEFGLAAEGSWYDKFKLIFPAPWYEFFVTTAPAGLYTPQGGDAQVTAGYQFSMQSLPSAAPVSPTLVARINPTPNLKTSAPSAGQAIKFLGLDMARWNALHVFTEEGLPYRSTQTQFTAASARNFYYLNPTTLRTMYGDNNGNVVPYVYYMMGAGDAASIHRYGFRPELTSTVWVADPTGGVAENNAELNVANNTIAQLIGRQIAEYHPTPLMALSNVALPLRPDIYPGFRYRYAPFKTTSTLTWDYYIESVTHSYAFGAPATTTLNLSRGLPSKVYAASENGGVLEAIHMGNAQRLNGQYQKGLPAGSAPALISFGPPDSIKQFMSNVAHIFVTPQQK